MKKFLFLIALFTLMGGANSVKARTSIDMSTATASTNATWTSGTNTFAWTAENEYVVIPGLSGDLTGAYLDFSISGECRIDIVYTDDTQTTGDWNGYGRFGSSGTKRQDLGLMAGSKINSVKEVHIASTKASGNITIENVSYFYPVVPKFNSEGVATISLKSLVASDGLSFDPSTGVVTCDGTAGRLSLEFLSGGVNLNNLKRYDVTISGSDNIIWRSIVKSQGTDVLSYYGSRWGGNLTDNERAKATAVNEFFWESKNDSQLADVAEGDRTFTITSITLTADAMQLSNLNSLKVAGPYAKWTDVTSTATIDEAATPAWNVGSATGTVYGDVNVNSLYYANLKDFKTMKIYVNASSATIRAMFNREAGNGAYFNVQVDPSNGNLTQPSYSSYADGVFTIDLAKILADKETVHLNAIKAAAGESNAYVDKVILVPITPNPYDYVLSGQYSSAVDISEFTSDASVTAIDCSTLSGNNVTITSSNPNCMFKARAGVLANNKNVIVGDDCANLVLTDGYPFKAPADFTATKASYSTTINAEAGAGTLCLPFAAAIPGGVTAYTLTYTSGDKAAATPVETTITANTPVLLNGSGANVFTGSGTVSASATNVQGALTGVFASASVPTNSYVLQNKGGNVSFYRVDSEDPITIPPFRAYLTSQGAGARSISISYGGVTNINEVKAKKAGEKDVYYNLNGQRVSNPTKGIFIVNGVKVSF